MLRLLSVHPRSGRCLCGVPVAHHFTQTNRKRSCEAARRAAGPAQPSPLRASVTGLRPTHGVIVGAILQVSA